MLKANGRTLRATYFRLTAQSGPDRTPHLDLVSFQGARLRLSQASFLVFESHALLTLMWLSFSDCGRFEGPKLS
jgi:hypothetical protein